MALSLITSAAATTAIPLSTSISAASGDPKGADPAQSRRPGERSGAPHQAQSTSAAPAYTLSGAATQASAKTSSVAGVQPDVDGDGARLLALQLQQDLSAQSTSIANASSSSILGLFKS